MIDFLLNGLIQTITIMAAIVGSVFLLAGAITITDRLGRGNTEYKTVVDYNDILNTFVMTKYNRGGRMLSTDTYTHKEVMGMLEQRARVVNPIELEITRDAEIELKQWVPSEMKVKSYE